MSPGKPTVPPRRHPAGQRRTGQHLHERPDPVATTSISASKGRPRILPPPKPTVGPRRLRGTPELLAALGHAPGCIELSRRGAISSCDCRIAPLEDPAIVVGMVIRFVQMVKPVRSALPDVVVELLVRQLIEGDAACWVIADWLVDLGLLDSRILPNARRPR